MLDYAQARRMMVDCQLRTFDVTNIPLLAAMEEIPRERFVPDGLQDLAYIDRNTRVAGGDEPRFMLSPMTTARLIQALDVGPGERVLDVACGFGYSSAVLGRLGANVVALESSQALADEARNRLQAGGAERIAVASGPLDRGAPEHAPFGAILVNGALEMAPDGLIAQLGPTGRLACVLAGGGASRAMLFVRSGDAVGSRALFDCAAPVLAAFRRELGFQF